MFSGTRRKILILTPLFLLFFYLLTYIVPLGIRPLMRPDEFRYGEIPREMLSTGDWVTPHLNGIRYFEKPALGYQLIAASFCCFGENAFALRLPFALSVLLTAIAIYLLSRKESSDPVMPGMAAGIYLTFGLVYGVGTFGVLDSALSLFLTWCIISFYFACKSEKTWHILCWLAASGICAGLAFQVKGFLAFAVPVVVLAPWLLWLCISQRDQLFHNRLYLKQLFLYPMVPLLFALLVALPWSVMIHRAEPDFWHYFFMEEHWNRFTGHTYDRAPKPFWYFLPILLGGMMPPGLLLIPGWKGFAGKYWKSPYFLFLVCWFLFPFLLFSASSCKLGTYVLPCFAPLALMIAHVVRRAMICSGGTFRRILNILCRITGWILLIGGIGCMAALLIFYAVPGLPRLFDAIQIPSVVAVLFAFYGFLLLRMRIRKPIKDLQMILCGLIPVIILSGYCLPLPALGDKTPSGGIQCCMGHIKLEKGDILAVDRTIAAAAAWELKRDDLIVFGKVGEFRYGIENYPEEYAGRYYPENEFLSLYSRKGDKRLYYLTSRDLKKKPLPEFLPVKQTFSAYGITIMEFGTENPVQVEPVEEQTATAEKVKAD